MNHTGQFSSKKIAILPPPDIYEDEYKYWPWGKVLEKSVDWLKDNLPMGAAVCDFMCGTGYLLNELSSARPDLMLSGCDLNSKFIEFGRTKYSHLCLSTADAREWKPPFLPDAILCTAGLHHLEDSDQSKFLDRLASILQPEGFFLLAEECIGVHTTELERRLAVTDLSSHLIRHLCHKEASEEVIQAALSVFSADLFRHGEYKLTYPQMLKHLKQRFSLVSSEQVWPESHSNFGDYLVICRSK